MNSPLAQCLGGTPSSPSTSYDNILFRFRVFDNHFNIFDADTFLELRKSILGDGACGGLSATVRRRRLRRQIVSMRLSVLSYSYHKYSNEIIANQVGVSICSIGRVIRIVRQFICTQSPAPLLLFIHGHASGSGSESSRQGRCKIRVSPLPPF